MANTITASIYSYQSNPNFTDQYGVVMGFATDRVIIRKLESPIQFNGVDCHSTIEVIDNTTPFQIYYAAETINQLV